MSVCVYVCGQLAVCRCVVCSLRYPRERVMGAGPDEHHCPEWQLPDLGHLQLPLPRADAPGHSVMALAC